MKPEPQKDTVFKTETTPVKPRFSVILLSCVHPYIKYMLKTFPALRNIGTLWEYPKAPEILKTPKPLKSGGRWEDEMKQRPKW